MKDTLMAAEMWFLWRMLRISWTEKKSNEEILREVGVQRTLIKSIRQWQLAFLGQIMRRHGLEITVVTGRIKGNTARGHQRLKYLDSLCTSWKDNVSPTQLIRASEESALASHGRQRRHRWHGTLITTTERGDLLSLRPTTVQIS